MNCRYNNSNNNKCIEEKVQDDGSDTVVERRGKYHIIIPRRKQKMRNETVRKYFSMTYFWIQKHR